MQVFLIRHSRPDIEPGRCYGQLDIPAFDIAATAEALAITLPAGLPVIASPLQRCRRLAEALHPVPRLDARLMEMNFGDWEGRTWDEIGREALDRWAAALFDHAPPGGESASMLQTRAVACLDSLAGEGLTACIVVTHAGVIRAASGHARTLPIAEWSQLPIAYGECLTLEWPAQPGDR